MADKSLNLVQSWIDVCCGAGEPLQHAVDALNSELGTNYTKQRLWDWRAGIRSVPRPVQDLMLRTVVQSAVAAEGGFIPPDDEANDRLAARLCPPPRH